jgi:hypothetical protein
MDRTDEMVRDQMDGYSAGYNAVVYRLVELARERPHDQILLLEISNLLHDEKAAAVAQRRAEWNAIFERTRLTIQCP